MKPIMKPRMKRSGVKFMAACWYERRRYPTIYLTVKREPTEEKVRRAIALLTQVRNELMCDEVRDFFGGSYTDPDRSCLVAMKAGILRYALQRHLRRRGLKETLADESVAGILKSLEKAGLA